MSFGVVVFEETGEERKVVRFCRKCDAGRACGKDVAIVSPRGIAHEQHEWHTERTACGKDATNPDWWWRL
jgi:hypothetical protein